METLFRRTFAGSWKHFRALLLYGRWRVARIRLRCGDSRGGPYPSGCYVLGVTPPVAAPTVTPSGGVGSTVTRVYVYTFVTPWGVDSAPSPLLPRLPATMMIPGRFPPLIPAAKQRDREQRGQRYPICRLCDYHIK
jgi:hypothetical protein